MPRFAHESCSLRPLFLDFAAFGWSRWIVFPAGVELHVCAGACAFPLGGHVAATSHAVLQSLVSAMRLRVDSGRPLGGRRAHDEPVPATGSRPGRDPDDEADVDMSRDADAAETRGASSVPPPSCVPDALDDMYALLVDAEPEARTANVVLRRFPATIATSCACH